MSRVKRGVVSRKKHKKILRQVKGYRMTRHRLIKVAKEASLHAGQYAYIGRKRKKRDMRRLWISRISAKLDEMGWSYNRFIAALKKKNINVNRKILANLVTSDPAAFEKIVKQTRE